MINIKPNSHIPSLNQSTSSCFHSSQESLADSRQELTISTNDEIIRDIRKQISTLSRKEMGIDRPTKSMILSMNDKLIQFAKLHEHGLETQAKKISVIDERIQKAFTSSTETRAPDVGLKRIQDQLSFMQSLFLENSSKKSSSFSSFDSSDDGVDKIAKEVEGMNKTLSKQAEGLSRDQHLNQERMDQFLSMLSVLQDAHTSLASQLEKKELNLIPTVSPKSKTSADQTVKELDGMKDQLSKIQSLLSQPLQNNEQKIISSINATLASYLPMNLESRLHDIQSSLQNQIGSGKGSEHKVDVLACWQQDIMTRHANMSASLDSIQHTLSKVVDCLDQNGYFSNKAANKLVEIKEPGQNKKVLELEAKVQRLTMERDEYKAQLNKSNVHNGVFSLLSRPTISRSSSGLNQ